MLTFSLLTFLTIFTLVFIIFFLLFKSKSKFSSTENSRYRALIDKSPDNIMLLNAAGFIVYVNEISEKTGGYPNEEIRGKHISQAGFFHIQDTPKYLGIIKRALMGEELGFIEVNYISKSNEDRVAQVSLGFIRLPDGFSGVQIVWRDITEEKRKDERLAELTEALKILNKILRHDILNDLTVITGSIEMYKEYGKDTIEDVFKDIISSSERSKELIHQMKELESAISSGSELTKINIKSEIEKSSSTFSDLNISIVGDGTVLADAAFPAIFSNFFRNSIRHGSAKNINIEIKNNKNNVVISIADDGKGIPDEVKPKLFNEGAKFGETGNTGLGLYIIRKTIERYGGTIKVMDNKPKGAKFIISL